MMDEKLKKIVDLMEKDDSVAAPADAVKWAKDLYRSYTPEARPSVLKRIVAILEASISPEKPAFGERSASAAEARQMLFTAGEKGVHLTISEMKRSVAVRGQLLAEDLGETSVTLAGDRSYTADVIDGEFEFGSVPRGDYQLTIRTDDTEIVVESLSL